jgi:sporadic carbohydrate cluster 2OG-Fe(II) oxygenase
MNHLQFVNSFLSQEEVAISSKFLEKGYYIGPAADELALSSIRKSFFNIVTKELGLGHKPKEEDLFNLIHEKISIDKLNDFRLHVIKQINSLPDFRLNYFKIVKPYLDIILGNELAMQVKINLSIQFPNDDSSLLPTHADTWSGDSPFEVVVWVPLVNCFKTKSMYILPPKENQKLNDSFKTSAGNSSEDLFNSIERKIEWMNVKYGEVLLFNMGLPHGNRVNQESETRWTMNCRFKGLFTPYSDKKLGSFFEPITLRAASINGMNYNQPTIK